MLQLPAALKNVRPEPKEGWQVKVQGDQVRWSAVSGAGVPDKDKAEFVINAVAPAKPGALWFKVRQDCASISKDWAEIPASGTSIDGLKFPAPLLRVVSAQEFALRDAVRVENAWVRPTVAGQQGTGGFMKLTARETMQLVGVSSPVAGVAEVHEMKMEGSVMKMRPVGVLDLPAGKTVELTPGGYHLMLMDLKRPLPKDSTIALTLVLRNAKGVQSLVDLRVPVAAPGTGPAAGSAGGHKH